MWNTYIARNGHFEYFTDLSPLDFAIFPTFKDELEGLKFENPDDHQKAVEKTIARNEF